jgi:hypothetical protein
VLDHLQKHFLLSLVFHLKSRRLSSDKTALRLHCFPLKNIAHLDARVLGGEYAAIALDIHSVLEFSCNIFITHQVRQQNMQ